MIIVIGEVFVDLDGIYLCNIENLLYLVFVIYYFFDGDGMIYVVGFCDGKVFYCN